MYRGAVFFDYDGTLVDESFQISSPTKTTLNALSLLKEQNYLVALCTGRAKSYIPKNINFDFDCYITSNGACAEINNQVVSNITIDKKELMSVSEFFLQNDINFAFECRDAVYCHDRAEKHLNAFLSFYNVPTEHFVEMNENSLENINKIIVTYSKKQLFEKFHAKYKNHYEFIPQHHSLQSYDIGIKDITKANGIEAVVAHLGIDPKKTYAFGDGENDLEMIKHVGTGVAMKKHAPSLSRHAAFITGNVKEEGVFDGLKRLGLI